LKDEGAKRANLMLGSRFVVPPNAYGCAQSSRYSATLHIALAYREVRAERNLFTHRRQRAWPSNMLSWCRLALHGLFGTPVASSRANSFSKLGIGPGTLSMWDAVFITSSIFFFVVCWLYVVACERC
jgi:hypothetical protein